MEKKKVKNDSVCYKLEEMLDNINETIDNINTLLRDQKELIDLCEEHKKDRFKDLIEQLKSQDEGYEEKLKSLIQKKNSITEIITKAKSDKNYDAFLTLVLTTLVNF